MPSATGDIRPRTIGWRHSSRTVERARSCARTLVKVVITVPGHGRQNLSQKHIGMIVRQLEAAGFDRDTVRRDLNAR